MLTIPESQKLVRKLIRLRNKFQKTGEKPDKIAFDKHQEACVRAFKYIIDIKTSKYKSFSNYLDLQQEGFVGMMQAFTTYKNGRGLFLWWLHKYVDTRIARQANRHTLIRYPLHLARHIVAKRDVMPDMITENTPEIEISDQDMKQYLLTLVEQLPVGHQTIIRLWFGLNNSGEAMSWTKICRQQKISREVCRALLQEGLTLLHNKMLE